MNKYCVEVSQLNPMETAPVWDYYDGKVDVVCLFYKDFIGNVYNVFGYFNRDVMAWLDHYSQEEIPEESLIGWLPDYQYVSTTRQ